MPDTNQNDAEEIDVTELYERLENLEKESNSQKETITKLAADCAECRSAIERLIAIVSER